MWITWSPISALVAQLWNVSEGDIDALAGVYMYIYVPGSFVSLWLIVHRLHLRKGLLVGALLNVSGALVRYQGMNDYSHVYIGTLLCAMAQTFTLSVPPLLSGNWFGADERATATSIGVLANQFGTAVGLGATGLINFTDSTGKLNVTTLETYLCIQLGAATLALLLVIVFVTADRPPTPPSTAATMLVSEMVVLPLCNDESKASEETLLLNGSTKMRLAETTPTYFESVHIVFQDALPFVLVFGLSVGTYYTIPAFLSQLVPWAPKQSGWLGVLYQLSGTIGSFVSGLTLDRFQHHRLLCLMLLCSAAASLVIFAFTNQYYFAVFGAGFCLAAMNTVGMEFGTALTYPSNEAAVAGILECAAELCGFLLVTIGSYLPNVGCGFLVLLCGVIACSIVILSCSHVVSRRPK
jgi:MFS family permease